MAAKAVLPGLAVVAAATVIAAGCGGASGEGPAQDPTSAQASFHTGVGSFSAPFDGETDEAALWFDRAEDLGVDTFSIHVLWATLVPEQPPADPTDPGSYDFGSIRTQAERAIDRGLEVVFTIWRAPDWAEGPGREDWAPEGTWRPDPQALADFATALARAFDGREGRPRVRFYEVWNEPNLSTFLTPQWSDGEEIASASHYREMLNAFHDAAKAVAPGNQIISAGVAPHGESVGTGPQPESGLRTRPLQFFRELICLERMASFPAECETEPRFDIAGLHPINRLAPPDRPPRDPDDLSPASASSLVDALRAAEQAGTLPEREQPRELWATEIWIETDPPDSEDGIALPRAGRRMALTLNLLWRAGVSRVINYVIRDQDPVPDGAGGEVFSVKGGFWHHPATLGGAVKRPLYDAFRFPLVAEREIGAPAASVWTRSPGSGELRIERAASGGWKEASTLQVRAGEVATAMVPLPKGARRLRARIGDQTSAVWELNP